MISRVQNSVALRAWEIGLVARRAVPVSNFPSAKLVIMIVTCKVLRKYLFFNDVNQQLAYSYHSYHRGHHYHHSPNAEMTLEVQVH